MSNTTDRGQFVWHELMTTDPEAAAGFYRAVVGWETKPWGHNVAYTLCVAPSGPVAGIMALPDDARAAGAPPAWLYYVGTPDLDATIAHATGLGARVLKGAAVIEGAGRYAVLADPYGATFGIYTPAQSAPQPAVALGQFVWHELATSDIEAALGFYRALFGWGEMRRMDMGATMGPYVIFGSDGTQRGGVHRSPPGADSGSHWLAYAHVPNADTATAAAVKGGARVLHGPADVPGGRISMMLDPQGVAFAVHSARMEAKPAAAAKKQPAPKAKPAPKKKAAPKRKAAARSKAAPARRKPAAKKAAKRTAAKRGKTARKAARKPARKVARKAPRRKSARRHR